MIQDSINRRTLLRGIATSAIIPAVGTEIGSAKPTDKHIVGTASKEATEAAKNKAAKVDRVIDFSEIGDAVAGKFPEEAIKGLKNRPDVRYIEADGTMEALGQTLPWGVDRIDADVAQQNGSTGSGADIAILDSGIDSDHPDLKDNLGTGYAVISCDGDCSTSWDDDHDHGTHCAGIANAVNNSDGVVGVSAEGTLHAVKVLDEYGTGTWSGIAEGIKWVADQGYDVASMSFGASSASSAVRDAVKYAYDKGVLLAAAAGNDGSCTDCVYYPAAYSEVIAVSSTDSSDELSYFSSTGPEIELAAPGSSIYSTVVDGYASYSGTSMACPHVSGAGGMVMASGKSNTEARQVLKDTAEDIGLSSNEQGNGLVDVEAAVGGGSDTTAPTSPSNLSSPAHTSSSVDLDWDGSSDDGTGVDHYNVYVDGTLDKQTTNTTETVSGLSSGTSYDFYVTAVDGAGNESAASSTVTVTTESIDLSTIDTTAAGDATFSGGWGDYTITGGGLDVWKDEDDYAAVYEDNVSGDVVAQVTVESQENTWEWAKAGIMVANDITADGSSVGDLILAATPGNGFAMQWDGDGDGYIESSVNVDSVSYPAELRLTKSGSDFTGEYSVNGGSTWTTIDTISIPEANSAQDIGPFVRGCKSKDDRGSVEFANFNVTAKSIDLKTIDTTATGDATFSGGGGDYTITGGGLDIWKDEDDYAAVYEDNVSGDVVAQVTVESQENTWEWAKAGIMFANDITADGSSVGDLILITTPGNGFAMQWDGDGDGYIESSVNVDSVSYPAELRLTKSGSDFTGEYSKDGGSTWTNIRTIEISKADFTQDIGAFNRGSKSKDERATVELENFGLKIID